MTDASSSRHFRVDLFWIAVSLLVLLGCLFYGYASKFPDLGFEMGLTWRVIAALPCDPGEDCVQAGDQIVAIGDVTYRKFSQDRTLSLLSGFKGKDQGPVRLTRGTARRTVEV